MRRKKVDSHEAFEIWALLHQCRDTIARARERELREIGVSMVQAGLLFVVNEIDGPATPAEISRRLLREPHTVNVLLKQMERKGLVNRTKDLERKNWVRVELTEKGKETYDKARDKKEAICEVMACLSDEERSCLREFLHRLRGEGLKILGVKHEFLFP